MTANKSTGHPAGPCMIGSFIHGPQCIVGQKSTLLSCQFVAQLALGQSKLGHVMPSGSLSEGGHLQRQGFKGT